MISSALFRNTVFVLQEAIQDSGVSFALRADLLAKLNNIMTKATDDEISSFMSGLCLSTLPKKRQRAVLVEAILEMISAPKDVIGKIARTALAKKSIRFAEKSSMAEDASGRVGKQVQLLPISSELTHESLVAAFKQDLWEDLLEEFGEKIKHSKMFRMVIFFVFAFDRALTEAEEKIDKKEIAVDKDVGDFFDRFKEEKKNKKNKEVITREIFENVMGSESIIHVDPRIAHCIEECILEKRRKKELISEDEIFGSLRESMPGYGLNPSDPFHAEIIDDYISRALKEGKERQKLSLKIFESLMGPLKYAPLDLRESEVLTLIDEYVSGEWKNGEERDFISCPIPKAYYERFDKIVDGFLEEDLLRGLLNLSN